MVHPGQEEPVVMVMAMVIHNDSCRNGEQLRVKTMTPKTGNATRGRNTNQSTA
jgi:hypothetical protein